MSHCVTVHLSCICRDRLLHVIDLLAAPRFAYDEQRKMLVPVPGPASVAGKTTDALKVYRNRLKLVLQVIWSTSWNHFISREFLPFT